MFFNFLLLIRYPKICRPKPEVQSVAKESQIVGSVGSGTYVSYLKTVQSVPIIVVVCILFVGSQVAMSGIDYFITRW